MNSSSRNTCRWNSAVAGDQVDQRNPIGEHQELTDQENEESDIDRVAAHREYARRHQPAGLVDVDADPEAVTE